MKNKEFGKIKKVKDWLANKDEVDELTVQVRKIIDDVILQAISKTASGQKMLTKSDMTSMIKGEINSFLSEKNEKS
jgi:hypothetical protein